MRLFIFPTLLILASVLPSSAEDPASGELLQENGKYVERTQQQFTVSSGGTLVLNAALGNVTVETWDKKEVQVRIEKWADVFTESEARAIFATYKVDIQANKQRVQVQTDAVTSRNPRSLNLSFRFTVPEQYNLDLRTSGGRITTGDLEGNIRAATKGGRIKVGQVRNGSVNIQTAGGSLNIQGVQNGDAEATTSGGGIHIGAITGNLTAITAGGSVVIGQVGGILKVETAGGSIRIEEGGNDLKARTAGGSIKIKKSGGRVDVKTAGGSLSIGPSGGNVKANTAGGSILVEESQGSVQANTAGGSIKIAGSGGPIEAETRGGSISIRKARGAIDASTAGGNIEAELIVADKNVDTRCVLSTSGGNLTIYLPETLAASIYAELNIRKQQNQEYRIYSDFPISTRGEGTQKITARGNINGGGDPVELTATDGDIHIKKLPPINKN